MSPALNDRVLPFFGEHEVKLLPILTDRNEARFEMCPARGVLRAIGYEQTKSQELPQPVTLPGEMKMTV